MPVFRERLLQLGNWLNINGEAIYNTSPWIYQEDSLNRDVWYTCAKSKHLINEIKEETINALQAVYAIFLKWPKDNKLRIKDLVSYINREDFQILMMNPDYENFVPVTVSV